MTLIVKYHHLIRQHKGTLRRIQLTLGIRKNFKLIHRLISHETNRTTKQRRQSRQFRRLHILYQPPQRHKCPFRRRKLTLARRITVIRNPFLHCEYPARIQPDKRITPETLGVFHTLKEKNVVFTHQPCQRRYRRRHVRNELTVHRNHIVILRQLLKLFKPHNLFPFLLFRTQKKRVELFLFNPPESGISFVISILYQYLLNLELRHDNTGSGGNTPAPTPGVVIIFAVQNHFLSQCFFYTMSKNIIHCCFFVKRTI